MPIQPGVVPTAGERRAAGGVWKGFTCDLCVGKDKEGELIHPSSFMLHIEDWHAREIEDEYATSVVEYPTAPAAADETQGTPDTLGGSQRCRCTPVLDHAERIARQASEGKEK